MSRIRFTRRSLRAAVGALWLIAGGLQLQPFMFTTGFAHDVLGSAALGQPQPLRATINLAERVVAANPAAWNWVFALGELVIGAGLVVGRSGRVARAAGYASVGAGLAIWVVGEGLGGLLSGTAALSTGAPGAALLYTLLTLQAWPRPAAGGELPLPAVGLRRLWSSVWLLGAALVLVPAQWGASGLSAQAAMSWMMSPRWSVGATLAVAKWLAAVPVAVAALICAASFLLHAFIGLAPRIPPLEGVLVITGAGLAVVYWVFGQGFGGISTGTATDVGTAPLIVLLSASVLARERPAHAAVNLPHAYAAAR